MKKGTVEKHIEKLERKLIFNSIGYAILMTFFPNKKECYKHLINELVSQYVDDVTMEYQGVFDKITEDDI